MNGNIMNRIMFNESMRSVNIEGKKYSARRSAFYDALGFVFGFLAVFPSFAWVALTYIALFKYVPDSAIVISAIIIYFLVVKKYVRFLMKRRKLVKALKKAEKEYNIKFTWLTNPLKNMHKPSGHADVIVETTNRIFHIMLFPSPKRLVNIYFTKPGEAIIETRFHVNNFTIAFGIKPKRRKVDCKVRISEDLNSFKHTIKVILLSPVPYNVSVPNKNDLGGVGDLWGDTYIHNMNSLLREVTRDAVAESQFF